MAGREDALREEWTDIKGYEGYYQISNLGRVKSLERKHSNGKIDTHLVKLSKRNYYTVTLWKNGKGKTYSIHRLVAEHFIPNPNNYKFVNHKDENKYNNSIDNLEWCTQFYNNNYGTARERQSNTRKEKYKSGKLIPKYKKVICITTNLEFKSIKEAAEFYKTTRSGIARSCKNNTKSSGKNPVNGEKLYWRFKEMK